MIAVDTSALMAVVLGEDKADACIAALGDEDEILISAVTVAEALIVADRRNVGEEMAGLIEGLGLQVLDLRAMGQGRSHRRP
jgi:ribonuclease VapC